MKTHHFGELSDAATVKIIASSYNIPVKWTFLRSPSQELASLGKEIFR